MSSVASLSDEKSFIQKMTSQDRFFESDLLMSRKVGNHLWHLVRNRKTEESAIMLDIFSKDEDTYTWKTLSESQSPFYYDCPMTLIRRSTNDSPDAVKWRQLVSERAETLKRIKAMPTAGLRVLHQGAVYELTRSVGKKGWVVTRDFDQKEFRMPWRILNPCLEAILKNKPEIEAWRLSESLHDSQANDHNSRAVLARKNQI